MSNLLSHFCLHFDNLLGVISSITSSFQLFGLFHDSINILQAIDNPSLEVQEPRAFLFCLFALAHGGDIFGLGSLFFLGGFRLGSNVFLDGIQLGQELCQLVILF